MKRKNILKIKQPFVVKRQGRRERHAFFDTIFLLPIVQFFYITCTITMYINFFLFNKISLLSFFLLVDYWNIDVFPVSGLKPEIEKIHPNTFLSSSLIAFNSTNVHHRDLAALNRGWRRWNFVSILATIQAFYVITDNFKRDKKKRKKRKKRWEIA